MINRVVLVGRMTKDADLRYTASGKAVATFTLAVNKFGKDEANFINCVVWDKKAESTANFTKKGSLVGVDGRIETRSYENNEGKRVYVTEVVADSVQFLEPKNGGDTNTPESKNESDTGQQGSYNDPFSKDSKTIDIEDDDLPF